MTTDNEIRAEQARQLMANPIFGEAFSNVREFIIAELESTAILDVEFRNQLGLTLQCLAEVKKDIQENIDTAMLDISD